MGKQTDGASKHLLVPGDEEDKFEAMVDLAEVADRLWRCRWAVVGQWVAIGSVGWLLVWQRCARSEEMSGCAAVGNGRNR
jgi:hypothetical protein